MSLPLSLFGVQVRRKIIGPSLRRNKTYVGVISTQHPSEKIIIIR